MRPILLPFAIAAALSLSPCALAQHAETGGISDAAMQSAAQLRQPTLRAAAGPRPPERSSFTGSVAVVRIGGSDSTRSSTTTTESGAGPSA